MNPNICQSESTENNQQPARPPFPAKKTGLHLRHHCRALAALLRRKKIAVDMNKTEVCFALAQSRGIYVLNKRITRNTSLDSVHFAITGNGSLWQVVSVNAARQTFGEIMSGWPFYILTV